MRSHPRFALRHGTKALQFPPCKERGRRSAKKRCQPLAASDRSALPRIRPSPRRASGGTRSPFGAPPRLSPEARRPIGSTPGHASWDADPAGVTRFRLSQSRESTSRTGRSTGVNDARSRPGAGRNAARGDRSRSTFESTLAKGPSANGMLDRVTIMGTNVNKALQKKRRRQSGLRMERSRMRGCGSVVFRPSY